MQEIITPFSLRYDGNATDEHVIDALQFGKSLTGAARIYNATAHYCLFGEVPKVNFRKEFTTFVSVPKEGCYDALVIIAALAPQNLIFAELGKEALAQVFFKTIAALKSLWTTNDSEAIVQELGKGLIDVANENAEVTKILANGIIQSNNNLSSLHEKLIETLPKLASSLRPSARELVTPIGKSCKTISQFHGTLSASEIDEPEADVIRSKDDLTIEEMTDFVCTAITEINRNTCHCEMMVEGFNGIMKGTISDPVLSKPGNVYTQSLDQQTPFKFSAKPVKKDGEIHRFYISDAECLE